MGWCREAGRHPAGRCCMHVFLGLIVPQDVICLPPARLACSAHRFEVDFVSPRPPGLGKSQAVHAVKVRWLGAGLGRLGCGGCRGAVGALCLPAIPSHDTWHL